MVQQNQPITLSASDASKACDELVKCIIRMNNTKLEEITQETSPVVCWSTQVEKLEWLTRRILEEQNFHFAEEELPDLLGFTIAIPGYSYHLILAKDLEPVAQIAMFLHILGHLVLGHFTAARPTVRAEFRNLRSLPTAAQLEERDADYWVYNLVENLGRACSLSIQEQTLTNASKHVRDYLLNRRGYTRSRLSMISKWLEDITTSIQLYRVIRRLKITQRMISALYYPFEG